VLFAFAYLLLRRVVRLSGDTRKFDDEVELAVLRHQLAVLRRQVPRPRLRRRDRLFMAALSRSLSRERWSSFLVSPGTLLRWHRELARRKWTYRRRYLVGRPPISGDVHELILRMGSENPRWGCLRIKGELTKLGISVSATKIRTLLRANGLGPAPRRDGPNWSQFLRAQAQAIMAFDFFTVETVWLRTLHVLFAIELASRRVVILGVSYHPHSSWMTQQARSLVIEGHLSGIKFVIHDHDTKFCGPFDEVFRTEEVKVVRTPVRAPRANAFAERWVRTVRAECLDWLHVIGRRHLERVLRAYAAHYNAARPHRGLGLMTPDSGPAPPLSPNAIRIQRGDVLGGLVHEYERAA